jgi:hypothetical protein
MVQERPESRRAFETYLSTAVIILKIYINFVSRVEVLGIVP